MSSFNRVTLMGNLTRDPELKRTKSGAAVADLGLAMNRSWSGEDGQKHEETTFVDVTVWGRQAENAAKYLQKGRSVLLEGRLQQDTWQDAQSGQKRSKLRVVAESLQFLSNQLTSGNPVGGGAHGSAEAQQSGSGNNYGNKAGSPVGWDAA